MNTITIGQQHYKWEITLHPWLGAMECIIYNIIDPVQKLIIVMEGMDEKVCTPQKVKVWIDYALSQDWYRNIRVYTLFEVNRQHRIAPLLYSLSQESKVAEDLATKFVKNIPSLEKSNIKYQITNLEKTIGLKLPTVLKQLYLHLGNGDFGPDYGFFTLYDDGVIPKITIAEAYQELHQSNIKDWDWQLPQLLVPFLYWGADIYSLVDCTSPSAAIYVLDKNLKKENSTWQSCVWQHCPSMMEWLQKWSKGDASGRSLWLEMYQLKGLV